MNAKVILVTAKQGPVLKGHPWIFPKAIAKTQGTLKTGDLVDVFNEQNELIGVGAYNEHSLYRVRVLALSANAQQFKDYESLITHRLMQAKILRDSLNLPNNQTTAYRVFNSEADGLSGVTIDRFNQTCVVSSTAYWVELNKERIMKALRVLFPMDEIHWLAQAKPLAQDGWHEQSSPITSSTKAEVLEEGIIYSVDFAQAQKTGLFLDQRENHARIASYAKGKRVLDLYTYTGGFALHAANAGASFVTAVDSSAAAITQARHNAALNELSNIEFIEADAREYLTKASEYDVVICDPPKLVPSQRHVNQAKNYYRFLHRELFKSMKSGSLLMTCNCSSALSAQEFSSLVSGQAQAVGKNARILGVYGPAVCHPTLSSFPEGSYLTAVLLAVV